MTKEGYLRFLQTKKGTGTKRASPLFLFGEKLTLKGGAGRAPSRAQRIVCV